MKNFWIFPVVFFFLFCFLSGQAVAQEEMNVSSTTESVKPSEDEESALENLAMVEDEGWEDTQEANADEIVLASKPAEVSTEDSGVIRSDEVVASTLKEEHEEQEAVLSEAVESKI